MPDVTPTASVIVPTYDRPDRLARCLDGLARLELPRADFEVIVVDDGGAADLERVIRHVASRIEIRLLRQENAGPASARNLGAAHAAGALLAFTDDDCVPDPRWLASLCARHREAPGAVIGGVTVNALSNNLCAQASQELLDYIHAYYTRKQGGAAFFTSNNMLVPRDRFLEMGGFDPAFRLAAGEDREFCDRWLAAGRAMVVAEDARVHHHHDLDLKRFWRQHFNYGRGAYGFHLRRRERMQRVAVEPLSFYTDLVLHPLRGHRIGARRLGLAALLGVSQVANVAGYAYERVAARSPTRVRSTDAAP